MDDDEAKFYLAVTRVVAVSLLVLAATIAGCNVVDSVYQDHAISQDIAHGADPLEARCAHSVESQECAVVAVRPKP